jgi:hypothetical protein
MGPVDQRHAVEEKKCVFAVGHKIAGILSHNFWLNREY